MIFEIEIGRKYKKKTCNTPGYILDSEQRMRWF